MTGCSSYHHYVLINESGKNLVDAKVSYPDLNWSSGNVFLMQGTSSSHGFIQLSIPTEAIVSYKDEISGESFSTKVPVKSQVPHWFNSRENELCFLILQKGVVTIAFWQEFSNERILWIPSEAPEDRRYRELNNQLIEFARKGDFAAVDRCLSEGADVNWYCWGTSQTPLLVSLHNIEMVNHLLKKGAKTRWELAIASRDNHMESVRALVEHGADIEAHGPFDDDSPLAAATYAGHLNIARYLIEKGADVNRSNNNGITSIYTSTLKNRYEIASLLIANGADVSASLSGFKWTALDNARRLHDNRMVQILEAAVQAKGGPE